MEGTESPTEDKRHAAAGGGDGLRNLIVLLVLILWSTWSYRYGLIGLPRGEHLTFFKEKILLNSEWDFFWKFVSLSRTRTFAPGGPLLFRPAGGAVLALTEIIFHRHFYAVGLITILWHSLTSFSLYLLLSKLIDRRIAVFMGLAFATQYPGMEMLIKRHISSNMGAPLFFALGLVLLHRLSSPAFSRKFFGLKQVLAQAAFFLSTLFHEAAAFALLGSGILFLLTPRRKPSPVFEGEPGRMPKSILLNICLWPFFLWLGFNLLDFLRYKPPFLFTPGEAEALGSLLSWRLAGYGALVAGMFLTAFGLPSLIRISYPDLWETGWVFSHTVVNAMFCLMGVLAIVLLLYTSVVLWKRYTEGRDTANAMIGIFAIAYLGVLIVTLAVGRLGLQGLSYAFGATYYLYQASYMGWIILAVLFDRALVSFKGGSRLKRLFVPAFLGLVFLNLVHSYQAIQRVLKTRFDYDEIAAKTITEIIRKVQTQKGFCYGGSFNPQISYYAPQALFDRQVCSEDRTALYVIEEDERRYLLAKFEETALEKIALDFSRDGRSLISVSSKGWASEDWEMILSLRSYDPILLEAKIDPRSRLGLVVGYEDPKNFHLLIVTRDELYLQMMQGGRLSEPSYLVDRKPSKDLSEALLRKSPFTLSVRKKGGSYAVFINQNLVRGLQGIPSIRGRVGLLYRDRGMNRQATADLKITEGNDLDAESLLKSVFRLDLPPLPTQPYRRPTGTEDDYSRVKIGTGSRFPVEKIILRLRDRMDLR